MQMDCAPFHFMVSDWIGLAPMHSWLELPPSTAHDATPASATQESKVSAPFYVAQVVVLAELEPARIIVVVPTDRRIYERAANLGEMFDSGGLSTDSLDDAPVRGKPPGRRRPSYRGPTTFRRLALGGV